MQLEAKTLLHDMRRACDLILAFTAGKDCLVYESDAYCRSAVERQFLIIGEALNRLAKQCPDVAAQIPSRRTIINFRNILVHGYDRVKNEVVWGVIKAHLPALRDAVVRLLESTG